MTIVYKVGDITKAEEPIIVHGCNAQGKMKSGVAAAIRAKYPKAYNDYMHAYHTEGLHLGQVIWSLNHPHTICNAITQEFYGRDGSKYVSYGAIREAFESIERSLTICNYPEGTPLAIPLIGAGLGGGHWETIVQIIEDATKNRTVVVYQFDG